MNFRWLLISLRIRKAKKPRQAVFPGPDLDNMLHNIEIHVNPLSCSSINCSYNTCLLKIKSLVGLNLEDMLGYLVRTKLNQIVSKFIK